MTLCCIYNKPAKVFFTSSFRNIETLIFNCITRLMLLSFLLIFFSVSAAYAQQQLQTPQFQSPSAPYISRSSVFRQEIARLEITVQRDGKPALSLTQVPRVQAGDVLKVNTAGIPKKPVQTNNQAAPVTSNQPAAKQTL